MGAAAKSLVLKNQSIDPERIILMSWVIKRTVNLEFVMQVAPFDDIMLSGNIQTAVRSSNISDLAWCQLA